METLVDVVPLPSADAVARTLTDARTGDAVAKRVPELLPHCDGAADRDEVVDEDTLDEPLVEESSVGETADDPENSADADLSKLPVGDTDDEAARVNDVEVVPDDENDGDPVEAGDSVTSTERDDVLDRSPEADGDDESRPDTDDWPEIDADGEIDGDAVCEREPEGESVDFEERLDDGDTLCDGVPVGDLDAIDVADGLEEDPLDSEANATLAVGEYDADIDGGALGDIGADCVARVDVVADRQVDKLGLGETLIVRSTEADADLQPVPLDDSEWETDDVPL